jgi:leucyl-tRNA synthetase
MDLLIPSNSLLFKNAIKSGFYDFTSARDFYREVSKSAGIGMNHPLVRRYIEVQALLLTPIAPHWAEYIWLEVLQKPDTIQNALFPDLGAVNPGLTLTHKFIRTTMSNITSAEGSLQRKLAKGKAVRYDPNAAKKLTIFFAKQFPAWQDHYMTTLQESFDKLGVIDVQNVTSNIDKKDLKKAMPFIRNIKNRLDAGESRSEVFDRKLPFDEGAVLEEIVPALKQVIRKCEEVVVVAVRADGQAQGLPPIAETAEPGNPAFHFENV